MVGWGMLEKVKSGGDLVGGIIHPSCGSDTHAALTNYVDKLCNNMIKFPSCGGPRNHSAIYQFRCSYNVKSHWKVEELNSAPE